MTNSDKYTSVAARFKGCVYGQAIGDALGVGTEGMTDEDMAWKYPHGLQHYNQIFQDRHRSRWEIGSWTDDTDMFLCIAQSVVEVRGVSYESIARHFRKWADTDPMGIGSHTYEVLRKEDYTVRPFDVSREVWEAGHRQSAANGGLMRTSVVGLFPKMVEEIACNVCRLTHYDPRCTGSCAIVSTLIHALVYGGQLPSLQDLVCMSSHYDSSLADYIYAAHDTADVRTLMDDEHMGYTLVTLSVALWAYWHASSFVEGLVRVVNAGGDADTNAAVSCAILGAKFGYDAIPHEYVSRLLHREQLDDVLAGLEQVCLGRNASA